MTEPAAPSASKLRPETAIDHFKVVRLLGKGGMGAVYLGEDTNLGRPVALKVLSPTLLEIEGYRERFHREARSAARLQHPNIIGIYHFGEVNGLPYYAMEYVEGVPLDSMLSQRGALPAAEVREIARQVVDGLAHAQEHGVIHRDLKPANLIQGKRGRIRILDFGLARMAQATSLTSSGTVMGTPDYMSPEQGLGKAVDHRADIYSLGVTLYHLLSGELPFRGDSALEVMMAHVQTTPPPLDRFGVDVPADLVAVVHRCMAKAADDRFPDYAALAAALRGGAGAPAPATSGAQPMASAAPVASGPATPAPVPSASPSGGSATLGPGSTSGPVMAASQLFPPDDRAPYRYFFDFVRHPRLSCQGILRRPAAGWGALAKLAGQVVLASWVVGLFQFNPVDAAFILFWHALLVGITFQVLALVRKRHIGFQQALELATWCAVPLVTSGLLGGLAVLWTIALVGMTAFRIFSGDLGAEAPPSGQFPKTPPLAPSSGAETVVTGPASES